MRRARPLTADEAALEAAGDARLRRTWRAKDPAGRSSSRTRKAGQDTPVLTDKERNEIERKAPRIALAMHEEWAPSVGPEGAPYPEHRKPGSKVPCSNVFARRGIRAGGDRTAAPAVRRVGRPSETRVEKLNRAITRPTVPKWRPAYDDPRGYCTRTGRSWLFDCEHHGIIRATLWCELLDCRTCAERVAQRRGRENFRRMGGVPLRAWVFTWPKRWHKRMGLEAVKLMRGWALDTLRSWHEEWWGAAGWLVNVHPAGDKDPRTWLPHVHILSPNLVFDREADGLRVAPYKVEPKALDDLRFMWQDVLRELAPAFGDEPSSVVANVNYKFRVKEPQVAHRIRYDCRPFPEWAVGLKRSGLESPIPYGLLASTPPKDVRHVAEEYLARVAGHVLEARVTPCPFAGCPHTLVLVGLKPKGRAFESTPLLEAMGSVCHPSIGPPKLAPVPMGPEPAWDLPY